MKKATVRIIFLSLLSLPVNVYADAGVRLPAINIQLTGTVTYACTQSASSANISWVNLAKSDIIHNSAEVKDYVYSITCGAETDAKIPLSITFTSGQGIDTTNLENNVINTNLEGVGLKLTWKNSALPPLVLSQVNYSELSGSGDYTVQAKPVSTGSGAIEGSFSTTMVMNVELY
jgi:type 1 fimbria pilin